MEQNTVENRDYFKALEAASVEEASSEAQKFSYARTLRTLGYALESYRFLAFEIRVENDDYVIKGSVPPAERNKSSFLRSLQDLFSNPSASSGEATQEIELRYSIGEIHNLDARERAQRVESPEIPDPHSLSQLLRCVGCYLDKRINDKLVDVTVKERWVTIIHRSRDGQLLKTRRDIEYFYDFWVKMYIQRSSRPSEPAPSEPTFFTAR